MTVTSAKRQISEIDRKVDAIHKQLRKLETIKPMSSESWQKAWDKHPELYEATRALYRKRGQLQLITGAAEAKIEARQMFAARREESKRAVKRTSIFQYLYDCKRAAQLLGFTELSQYYALALHEWKQVAA